MNFHLRSHEGVSNGSDCSMVIANKENSEAPAPPLVKGHHRKQVTQWRKPVEARRLLIRDTFLLLVVLIREVKEKCLTLSFWRCGIPHLAKLLACGDLIVAW